MKALENKLKNYKVHIIIRRTLKDIYEDKFNYNKDYKKVISVQVNQNQFTLYRYMTFYYGINQDKDGSIIKKYLTMD